MSEKSKGKTKPKKLHNKWLKSGQNFPNKKLKRRQLDRTLLKNNYEREQICGNYPFIRF